MVLGEAPQRLLRPRRAGRLLGGARHHAGADRRAGASAPTWHGRDARRGRRRAARDLPGGLRSLPLVRTREGPRRTHSPASRHPADAGATLARRGARAGARGVLRPRPRRVARDRRRAAGAPRGDSPPAELPPARPVLGHRRTTGVVGRRLGTLRRALGGAPVRALAGLPRAPAARLALPAGRGSLRTRGDDRHDALYGEHRVLYALPPGLPLPDGGDLAPERPRAAGGLPRPRPRAAPAARAWLLRSGEQAVGLGAWHGGRPLLRAHPRRHLPALRRGPLPQLHRDAVPDGPGRGRPGRALRLSLGPRRAPFRRTRLLDGALPSDSRLLPGGCAGFRGAPVLAVPALPRQEKRRRAVSLARLARPPLGTLRLGHLRPAAPRRRAPRAGRDGPGERGGGDGHRYQAYLRPRTPAGDDLRAGGVARVAWRDPGGGGAVAQEGGCPAGARLPDPYPLGPTRLRGEPHLFERLP